MSRLRIALSAVLVSCGLVAGGGAPARADHTQESIFQDDQYLIYSSTATVTRTLGILHSLGVRRLRITLKWSAIAPAPGSYRAPAGFTASDPFAYPAGAWAPYDRVVTLAAHRGIGVEFNLTAPGPLWAMRRDTPSTVAADHWAPSARAFLEFVYAAGLRYSGRFAGIPRVHVWSIWNEPNQPGWLAPQWRAAAGRQVPASPVLYRQYVDAAFIALAVSGHLVGHDTILIGELAPEGYESPGSYTAMTPMPFLRALYCVDASYRRLRGHSAAELGCPVRGPRADFVSANPGLFYASGFAHHPYYFFYPPRHSAADPNFVPLADLGRLENGLDRSFRAYSVQRRIPLYITEYGYQTNPPDPYQVVTPEQQASYLNQADYMAWRDPRIRSVAQFLLRDSPPNPNYPALDPKHWGTFQTGLQFADGTSKPALAAYRMPIWIPGSAGGARVFVWGQLRPAPHHRPQRALIQWQRPGRAFRTIATVLTRNVRGYLTARVVVPGSGELRIGWRPARGRMLVSRAVAVG